MPVSQAKREADQRWRLANPRAIIKANRNLQHKRMDMVRKAKEVPCRDCGHSFPHYVMDLDHRPGEVKCFNLALASKHSFAEIKIELRKCDPICANCHRERTYQRGAKRKTQTL